MSEPIDISPSQRKDLVALIQRYLPNVEVWAFGSRVKWTARSNSDLDLVAFAKPEDESRVSQLKEEIEESSLPFRVDLLVWDNIPQSFQENIQALYVVLVEAEKTGRGGVMAATDLQQPEIISQITGPLGNFVEFKNGRSSPDRTDFGAFAVYGSNGEIGRADVTNAPEGTLVVGRVGSYCGSVHYSPNKCWVTDNAIIGSSRNQKDSRFWFYKLASLDLNNYRAGSGQPLLNQQILNSIQVSIPASEDDRFQIAKALAAFDDKIALNHRINQTLESMAQAIFKSWFVDFDPVKAKIAAIAEGRDPLRVAMRTISGKSDAELDALPAEQYDPLAATAALFPDEMEESELGEIPRGWEVQRVGNLLELAYGKALKSTDRKEGGVPVYGSGGITGYHNAALVPNGSIVVGRKGTVGSLYWEDEPFFPIDTTYYVRPLTVPLTYCYYAMQTLGLEKMNTDAAVPGLNRENVYRLELVRPDSPVLQKFDTEVSTLRKALRANSGANKVLANLRDCLLPKLLSGELSVTDVMAEVEA